MNAIPASLHRLAVTAVLTSGLTAAAQSIEFYTLQKVQNFTQTGSGSSTPDAVNPWTISATIQGTALDSTHPATLPLVTTPSGSGISSFNLTYHVVYGWEYMLDYGSQGALDLAYKNGTFTSQMGFGTTSPFNLNLAGDFYPNNPIAALTGGTWLGGVYQLNPATAWSLDSGTFTFSAPVGAANSRMEITIQGTGVNFSKNAGFGTVDTFTGLTGSMTLNSTDAGAPTFLAGNNYNVEIRYLSGTDYLDIGTAVGQTAGSAFGAALYDSHLSFTIQAVPEPATYAVWAGLLAIGLACWRRRIRPV
jgi:hypothetical protein